MEYLCEEGECRVSGNKNWKNHVIPKSKEEIMEQVKMVAVALVGVFVAAGSFWLYKNFKAFPIVLPF